MNRFKLLCGATIVLALLVFAIAPQLQAANQGGNDVWNKKTTMNFTQPFEIPGGKTLPAGTYVFRLLDSPYDREIVQIFDENQTHIYATVLTIPNRRLTAPNETVIRFQERASGAPQALKAWFHPGDRMGHEFVYGRARAIELARLTNEPVPAIPQQYEAQLVAPAEPAGQAPAESLAQAPITIVEPSGHEATVTEVAEFAPPANLPATAGSLPLIGLIGLMLLCAGLVFRIITRQNA